MERLSRHIGQAHKDVNEVSVSARKITTRFDQIERVEIDDLPEPESGLLAANKAASRAGELG
jgi:DNA recombination protein RmuC